MISLDGTLGIPSRVARKSYGILRCVPGVRIEVSSVASVRRSPVMRTHSIASFHFGELMLELMSYRYGIA